MELKQYLDTKFAEARQEKLSYALQGRIADEKVVENYKDNIVASLENEFGWAFVLKGKIGYFFFTLLKDVGFNYSNRLVRWKYDESEQKFIQEFGDKLIVKKQDEYSRIINQIAMKKLKQEK